MIIKNILPKAHSYILNKQNIKTICTLTKLFHGNLFKRYVFSVLSLTLIITLLPGCAPKFRINNYYNNLRGTHVCKMENNIIKKTNCRGTVNFNLSKDTECKPPYGLSVLISAINCSPGFRDDSIAALCLIRNGQKEILKIVSDSACHDSCEQISTTPGYFIDGFYMPGSVYSTTYAFSGLYFPLDRKQIQKIVDADQIDFEIETTGMQTVIGTLSQDNINNIKAFGCQCFSY